MTCTQACQRSDTPSCTCRECRGKHHGALSRQPRLSFEAAQEPDGPRRIAGLLPERTRRLATDVAVSGQVVHCSPASRHYLDGRIEYGWVARLPDGTRSWGVTPALAAEGAA